jgi:hypothetical protein
VAEVVFLRKSDGGLVAAYYLVLVEKQRRKLVGPKEVLSFLVLTPVILLPQKKTSKTGSVLPYLEHRKVCCVV